MKNTEREYKMRAECLSDADLIRPYLAPWLKHWQVFECHLPGDDGTPLWIPDVEVEFTIRAEGPSKGQLKWLVNSIDDCHVAAESLDGATEYTGRRHDLDDADCIVAAPSPELMNQSLQNLGRYREYLEMQMERLADARGSLEVTAAIARLSSCAKTERAAGRRRRAAAKR